ncbi:LacI family DNA-binding transcriptional regulator [Streptomyces violaceusniger]|uniref:Transcriptional regulator, LacI family n=1 Tax=Streptomyces violaceusniger (strain Tu 4113) TaxID=653045 RepID=G2P9I6_STRV4|nr:LacI family DNA-binding transcriptional regulator [Streptomyces violaceusniger]AEM88306.1 transcriptional regulator, LacI family [Streptomyces violaceusniger Tu 4113]
MGFVEDRGTYWRGRYKISPGKYGTVADGDGSTIRFRTKREAKQAADAEEAKVRAGDWKDPTAGRITFGEYATRWYAAQDLAASTMQNYRRHLEEHLLPEFEDRPLASIQRVDVDAWDRKERALYAASSVKTWRGTLHLVLEDAVDEALITSNPATKRRGRGKRAGRSRDRGPEKVVTDPIGILLTAERASLLSGRDDEFVGVVTKGYTGMRWGEVVGLETDFIRPTAVRVEWQLYELDSGEFERCPPKDDSHRTIDAALWLVRLWTRHIAHTRPTPCPCHGKTYMFRGHGVSRTGETGAKVVDVARRAGVSTGTVSNVLNRPDAVAEATRARVQEAIDALGFTRGGGAVDQAAHWRRNGFATWLFTPAASGWYPKKAPQEARPVPVLADPWPGVPARGRGAQTRADACWMPIARGLTPHGLRHTHKTRMEGFRTPPKLMDERMGHIDGSVQARYSHITREMRADLLAHLTAEWEAALDARLAMCPTSPVAVLNELLQERLRVRR